MYFDTEVKGFGVRVGRSGVKTFILQARTRTGRTWRTPLGRFPALNVSQARTRAKELIGELAKGRDPFAEREPERNRPPAYTVGMAIEDWRAYRAAYGSPNYAAKAARTLLAALADRLDQPAARYLAQRSAPLVDRGRASGPRRARPRAARNAVLSRHGCAPCTATPSRRGGLTLATIQLWR